LPYPLETGRTTAMEPFGFTRGEWAGEWRMGSSE
jgi:hypothetical protein